VGGPTASAAHDKLGISGLVASTSLDVASATDFPPCHLGFVWHQVDMMVLFPPCIFLMVAEECGVPQWD